MPRDADETAKPERLRWSPAMDQLIGSDFDAAVARRLGIDTEQVARRRRALGIAAHAWPQHVWSPEEDALLSRETVASVSRQLGIPTSQVKKRMAELGALPVRTRRAIKSGR
jgi:hypothetical protein